VYVFQARSRSAVVVVVGTHVDKIKNFEREKKLFAKRIEELYNNQYCYPPIKAIKFVGCDVKYKRYDVLLKDLRDTLYDMASAMKLSLSKKRTPYVYSVLILLL